MICLSSAGNHIWAQVQIKKFDIYSQATVIQVKKAILETQLEQLSNNTATPKNYDIIVHTRAIEGSKS